MIIAIFPKHLLAALADTVLLHASSLEYGLLLGYINIYVLHSVEKGYATFLCGMAQGFDIICGETILRLKRHKGYEHIRLIFIAHVLSQPRKHQHYGMHTLFR